MIDLHTHTLLSDGELLPSELVRRALAAGYSAIALTDHVDHSNIEPVLEGLKKSAGVLGKYWDITVLPGVELTHLPLEVFAEMAGRARKKGALIVVAHGESPVEPVLPGTNRAAIEAGVDILAHPGNISDEDAALAAAKGVYLEITCRKGHDMTNRHVLETALRNGASLVLNTDAHAPGDILSREKIEAVLSAAGAASELKKAVWENMSAIVQRAGAAG